MAVKVIRLNFFSAQNIKILYEFEYEERTLKSKTICVVHLRQVPCI